MLLTKVDARYRRIVAGLPLWAIVACLSLYGLVEAGKRAEKFEKTQSDLRAVLEQLRAGLEATDGGGGGEAAARRRAVCARYWQEGAVFADADELFAEMRPALHQSQELMTIACQVQEQTGAEFRAKVGQAVSELGNALDTFQAESHENHRQKTRWVWFGLVTLLGLSAAATVCGIWGVWKTIESTFFVGRRTMAGDPESRGRWVRTAYESSTEGILIMEAGGEIRFANAAAERLLGYRQGELSGHGVGEVPGLVVPMKQVDGLAEPPVHTERAGGAVRGRLRPPRRRSSTNGENRALIASADAAGGDSEESNSGDAGAQLVSEPVFRESMQLLNTEMMSLGALKNLDAAYSAANDAVRGDLDMMRRATARAAFLVGEALFEKTEPKWAATQFRSQSLLIAIADRMKTLLNPGVEVALAPGYPEDEVLADFRAVENAAISLVLHWLPAGSDRRKVCLIATAGGSIELIVVALHGAAPKWKRVDAAEGFPRYAEWLRSEGASIETDLSDGACRFRISLQPAVSRTANWQRQAD
ncbi:MAG: PAS domain-containing protein [Bryobacterales bacterium]|nr:PAS domain-containing protein [Bryobacterales bacterium]